MNNLSEITQYDYVIALRVETPDGIDSQAQIDYVYDYHFAIIAKQNADASIDEYGWADKHGLGYNRFTSFGECEDSVWKADDNGATRYYDSKIIYIAIGGTME